MNNWIPVTDRLPEREDVIVLYDGKDTKAVTLGTRMLYGWWDCLRQDDLYGVTHWQPFTLPEPPKGE